MKKILFAFFLALLQVCAFAQTPFTAPWGFNYSAPTGAPSALGTRVRFDITTGRIYTWSPDALNWQLQGYTIDQISGTSAPAYAPVRGQSWFAVNGDTLPRLYQYTGSGTVWKCLNCSDGKTYTAGTGITLSGPNLTVINNAGDLSNTNELNTGFDVSGGNLRIIDAGATRTVAVTSIAPDQSVTNEIQTIDTFLVSGSNLLLSLTQDNQPAKTITLPASGITALTGDVTATGPGSAVATIATASASVRGLLSSADWNTFNGKLGGSGTTGFLPKFSSSTAITNSIIQENGTGFVSIGGTPPNNLQLDIMSRSAGRPCLRLSDNETDATNKIGMMLGRHYLNSEADILGFWFSNISTGGRLIFGGGSASYNSSESLLFFTGNGSNIRTGTERMRISSIGNIGIGTTSTPARLTIVGAGATSSTNNLLVTNSAAAPVIKSQDDRKVTLGYNLDFTESSTAVGNGVNVINSNALALTIGAGSSNFNFSAGSIANIVSNGNTVLRAFPSGVNCVSIGAGANPSYTLDVLGSAGNLGVRGNTLLGADGTAATSRADIIGANGYSQLRLRTKYTPTSTADTNGNTGDISWDENYFYVKTAAGWKRSALSTF